jgi:branched-chain amino acid transport system substrate-binding protein
MTLSFIRNLTLLMSFLSLNVFAEVGVTEKEIVLGQSLGLTGTVSAISEQIVKGQSIFFDKLNSSGGIHGRKIRVVTYDDQYEPKANLENLKKLVSQDKVFLIFQNYGSAAAKAAVSFIKTEKIPFFSPGASAEELRVPLIKHYFMVRASSAVEMETLIAHVVAKKDIKKIGVVYQTDAFGSGARGGAAQALAKRNLKFDVELGTYRDPDAEMAKVADTIIAKKPDAIVLGTQSRVAATLINSLFEKDKGYHPLFLGGMVHNISEFTDAVKAANPKVMIASGIPIVHASSRLAIVKTFLEEAKSAGAVGSSSVFEGYLSAKILVEGLTKTGKDLTRKGFEDALEAMVKYDFGGASVWYSSASHRGIDMSWLAELKTNEFIPIED